MRRRRFCSFPNIFGLREKFEARYGDCCKLHDSRYANKDISRLDADVEFLVCMLKRGKPYKAILAYMAVRVFGWFHYDD